MQFVSAAEQLVRRLQCRISHLHVEARGEVYRDTRRQVGLLSTMKPYSQEILNFLIKAGRAGVLPSTPASVYGLLPLISLGSLNYI